MSDSSRDFEPDHFDTNESSQPLGLEAGAPQFRRRRRSAPYLRRQLENNSATVSLVLIGITTGCLLCQALGLLHPFAEVAIGWLSVSMLAAAVLIIRNAPNTTDLVARNRFLADRLEALEDKSWEIRESEEIHRSLAESFGDVVLHRDQKGEITFVNSVFKRYFEADSELPEPAVPTLTGSENSSVTANGGARDIQADTVLGKRWFSWADLYFRDPITGKQGIRSVGRDITKRKNNEQKLAEALKRADEASAAKSQFLAMVSHEIRTPLNGVMGMASLLKSTELDACQRDYLSAIDQSSSALAALIEDLLDAAQIEAGKVKLETGPVNLLKLVEDVADILGPRARDKGLDLATHVPLHLPATIQSDAGRLRQILINLLGNAVKFTESGGVALSVNLARSHSSKREPRLVFKVTDMGPGISDEDKKRIFQAFQQVDSGASRRHEGAGLGLSISRQLANLFGGELSVSDGEDCGTCFTLSLPIELSSVPLPANKAVEKVAGLYLEAGPACDALAATIGDLGHKVIARPENITLEGVGGYDTIVLSRDYMKRHDMAEPLKEFRDKGGRLILLGNAGEQHDQLITADGWLTWPVRRTTLARVLKGNSSKATKKVAETIMPKAERALNVLMAEDNPVNALLVRTMLKQIGHSCTHVTDGAKALGEVRNSIDSGKRFDAILMDLHMPGMDGIEAIKAVRTLEMRMATDPHLIIVLSADGQSESRDAALACGADNYLLKPLSPEGLADVLATPHRESSPRAAETA